MADADNAAGGDDVQPAPPGLGQKRIALGAGIDPDLADPLALEFVEQLLTDLGLYVDGRHID